MNCLFLPPDPAPARSALSLRQEVFAPGAGAQPSAGPAAGVSAAAAADPVAHVFVLGTYPFAKSWPGRDAYVRFAQVGARDGYVGAELLSKWYERNIYMFANIREMVEPGDRILVIVGGGHAPILRELITYDPHLLLVDVLDYLPAR